MGASQKRLDYPLRLPKRLPKRLLAVVVAAIVGAIVLDGCAPTERSVQPAEIARASHAAPTDDFWGAPPRSLKPVEAEKPRGQASPMTHEQKGRPGAEGPGASSSTGRIATLVEPPTPEPARPAAPYPADGRALPVAALPGEGRAPTQDLDARSGAVSGDALAAASIVEVDPPAAARPRSGDGAGKTVLISNIEGALHVPAGRSVLARLSRPAERVAVADPDVAEVVVVSPRELLINGKGHRVNLKDGNVVVREAQTSIVVWDREGHSDMRTLYVNRSRTEQILLEVIVAEVNRTALERYGVDFAFLEDGNFLLSTPSRVVTAGDRFEGSFNSGAKGVTGDLPLADSRLTMLYRNLNEDLVLFLEALQQESLAKILARPVVLARSGEQAHLRVGGEVPVVFATANVATITFKEFGVLLTFTPEFTDSGRIDLRVKMEVSEPSQALGTTFQGFEVPSFVGRQAETRVLLNAGQTLMIGGLYREQTTESEDKVPYLGDIPFLGPLFRKTVYEMNRTELLMAVKPAVAADSESLEVTRYPTDVPPLTREEVRTLKPNPYGVTRPRPTPPSAPPDYERKSARELLKDGLE